jgi:winged helix DNA-binding protein
VVALHWDQALAWRLRRHLLDPVGTCSVKDVVSRLAAIPAHPETTPELAVGLRRIGARVGDVARALDAGEVFKTYAFRGATHLLTPEEGGAYLALRASGRQWELRSWQETYGLAPGDWPVFRETVREAVAVQPLTRHELSVEVRRRRRFRDAAAGLNSNSDTLLKSLMWQGDLCFGPARDGEATVQGLHRIARWAGLPDIDDAGRWAVEAYVRTYGPTSADSVQYYLGAGLSAGRKALRGWLDDLSDRLVTVDIDGEDMILFADDADDLVSTEGPPTVRLLPAADPWVMGPGTADPHVVPPANRQPVTRGANLVVASGVVAGTWTRKAGTLTVAWFDEANPPEHDLLVEEASRLSAVLGTELALSVTPA